MLLGLVVVAVACNSLGNYLSIWVYVSLGARSPAIAPMLGLSVWEGASQVRSPTQNPLHPRYSQLVFVIAESRFMYPPMPGIPMNENTIYALASEVVSVVPCTYPRVVSGTTREKRPLDVFGVLCFSITTMLFSGGALPSPFINQNPKMMEG